MSSIIRNRKENIKVKDISESGIIDYKNNSKVIEIKTAKQRLNQNKQLIKDEKQFDYTNKVVDIKKNLTSKSTKNANNINKHANKKTDSKENIVNDIEKINAIKNDYKANEKIEESRTGSKKNNRYLLSKKVLKIADVGVDALLNIDENDLGLDTIRKTKNGIKRASIISEKGIRLNKMLTKKAYKMVTSENAKNIYRTSREVTKKMYENTRDFTTKIYIKSKVAQATKGSKILKDKQRKEQIKKARKNLAEKSEQLIYNLSARIKNILVEIFTKKTVLIGLIIFLLILTLVCSIIGVTTLFAYSTNLVLDEESEYIYDYISELDKNINMQINNAETDYPRL